MKYIKAFENIKLKYNVGDYVKYTGNKSRIFMIEDIDDNDVNYPYYLIVVDYDEDKDKGVVGDSYWTSDEELYTNDETELYQNQNKYNL